MDDMLRKKAEKLLHQTETLEHETENPEIVRLLHELRVYQTELQLQTEQLMKTQSELQLSEREYYEYYQLAPVCYFKVDRNGVILSANQRCHGLIMQLRGRNLEGKSLLNYIDPGYHQVFLDHLQQVFIGKESLTCELSLRQYGDAPRIYVHLQSRVVEQRAGKVCWMIMAEITDRKILEAELSASERRLREAQRIAQLGHWYYDFRKDEAYWSDEMYILLGYKTGEVKASLPLFEQHVYHEDVQQVQNAFQQSLEQNQSFQIEIRYVRRNGEIRYGALISTTKNNPTEQHFIRGIFQDITDQQQMRSEMLNLQLEEERSRLLAHFITNASHEFRTPLAIILSSSELLMRRANQPDLTPRFQTINRQVKRVEYLLDNLLLMTRLDTMKLVERTLIAPESFINLLAEKLDAELKDKNIQLVIEMPGHLLDISIDEDLMLTAFECILQNAIQYSQADQTVTLHLQQDQTISRFKIIDEGMGMNQEVIARAFQRFYRADAAHATAGFGLGLSIAQSIIEKHNGTIMLDSEPGQGTTVTVSLPHTV